jgi:serine/threonine protein kinase
MRLPRQVGAGRPRACWPLTAGNCSALLPAGWLTQRAVPRQVSAPARDLVARLLTYRPAERITAEAALRHEWLAMADGVKTLNTTQNNLRSLRSLRSGARLKRTMLAAAATTRSPPPQRSPRPHPYPLTSTPTPDWVLPILLPPPPTPAHPAADVAHQRRWDDGISPSSSPHSPTTSVTPLFALHSGRRRARS